MTFELFLILLVVGGFSLGMLFLPGGNPRGDFLALRAAVALFFIQRNFFLARFFRLLLRSRLFLLF